MLCYPSQLIYWSTVPCILREQTPYGLFWLYRKRNLNMSKAVMPMPSYDKYYSVYSRYFVSWFINVKPRRNECNSNDVTAASRPVDEVLWSFSVTVFSSELQNSKNKFNKTLFQRKWHKRFSANFNFGFQTKKNWSWWPKSWKFWKKENSFFCLCKP